MKNFCPQCGAEIPPNAMFCPFCGSKIVDKEIKGNQINPAVRNTPDIIHTSEFERYHCVYCGATFIAPEIIEVRMQSRWGFRLYRFKVVICPHCGYSHFFIKKK